MVKRIEGMPRGRRRFSRHGQADPRGVDPQGDAHVLRLTPGELMIGESEELKKAKEWVGA